MHAGRFSGRRIPDYLCKECAEHMNGSWHSDHEGKFLNDFCEVCEEFTSVTHKRGWYFPSEVTYGYVID